MKTLKKRDIVYISGPMTGIPEENYPAFLAAEVRLREAVGCVVLNPAKQPARETWIDYMRHDIKLLCEATAVLLLPGHENSKGATLERHIAEHLSLRIVEADQWM